MRFYLRNNQKRFVFDIFELRDYIHSHQSEFEGQPVNIFELITNMLPGDFLGFCNWDLICVKGHV